MTTTGRAPARRRRSLGASLTRWLGMALLCLLAFGSAREGVARVRPYYVLQGASFGQIEPRILFVVDTSGSMSWRASGLLSGFRGCEWADCETVEGGAESRIAAARRAIRRVIDSSEAASFALMTFEQPQPHTTVPPTCTGAPGTRFTWATEYFAVPLTLGITSPEPIRAHDGVNGMWRLCQGNIKRPYPYLRWDGLGAGSVSVGQHEVGEVPPSPLLDPASGLFDSPVNASRRVQWFPRFLGVRVHLEDNPEDNAVLYETVGDYGSDPASVVSSVRGHDFYYWPYVDGFPGYGHWSTSPYDFANPIESAAGVSSLDFYAVRQAQLYSPFYLDLEDVVEVPASARGPSSPEASRALVQGLTSPLTEGGIDVAGATPWSSAIGDIPPVGSTTYDNRPFTHSTVASYLRFVTTAAENDRCAPTSVVLLTDGEPFPYSSEGGSDLFYRISRLRTELNVPTYVVGFFIDANSINDMACAGNGVCAGVECWTPCQDFSPNDWDTCADPSDPTNNCAYQANTVEDLEVVFAEIIDGVIDLDLASGPGSAVNDFGVGSTNGVSDGSALQTLFNSFTDWPGWRGHVTRGVCTDVFPDDHPDSPGELMPHCVDPGFLEPGDPGYEALDVPFRVGPCDPSRSWDAGDCLQQTTWSDRRVYTNVYEPGSEGGPNHRVVRISDDDGQATGDFIAVLNARGLLTGSDPQQEADEFVSFILGERAPGGWKLPGLANSAPIVVRRIPEYRPDRLPEVAIRDPHCAGRVLTNIETGALPISLSQFAADAWNAEGVLGSGNGEHYEYEEAVLVGDDMGMLHAFQLDSGNELFGFIPQFALENAVRQAAIGPLTMGQPDELEEHIFGLSATLNHGWVPDRTGADIQWRHLGIIGMGAGGTEYVALDLSHMSPDSDRGQLEVLWTSEDPDLAAAYDTYNGETWARPALTYHVDNDQITSVPDAFLLLGGGYPSAVEDGDPPPPAEQGRTLMQVNAITGEIVEAAVLPEPKTPLYEEAYGALVDPAVGSHCLSRFWAEMQEVYVADPAGRLFRWDQGRDTAHAADSGSVWGATALPVFTFRACEGEGTCSIDAGDPGDASNPGGAGDVFVFPPAVTANDRIDDATAGVGGGGGVPEGVDQFLIAMISGSPYEDTLDHTLDGNQFHSSIYLMVDDHSTGDPNEGFSIPADGGKAFPGDSSRYMRIALSDIKRTRSVVPYEGAAPLPDETRVFSRSARPVRAPRVFVTGVVNEEGVPIDDVEVYYVTFTVYEPGSGECNADFFDPVTETWHFDEGSTYEITFRLTADSVSGFNFLTGTTSDAVDFPTGFSPELELVTVEQLNDQTGQGCTDGNCGPSPGAPAPMPCDNNSYTEPTRSSFALTVNQNELSGFTPVE